MFQKLRTLLRKNTTRQARVPQRRRFRGELEQLEKRDLLSVYTPGNLIVLQGGNGTAFTNQAPLFLNEYTTTAGAALVQQAAIPNNQAVGGTGNQPITIDLTAAAGNGQLNRSYDGSVLTFGAVDSGVNNGNFVSPQTPTGSGDRVTAVVGNNLNNITAATWSAGTVTVTTAAAHGYTAGQSVTITGMTPTGYNGTFTVTPVTGQPTQFTYSLATNPGTATAFGIAGNFFDTTTHGQYYVGDDNRGAVAEGPLGPIYTVGHPNQNGAAVSQGVLYFGTEGPALGTQISAGANIRGATIGFDNRLYWSTAGSTATGLAGVYTETVALPTAANANPAADVPVVKALFTASKLGGVFLADVNGDGIVDNGDRIYFNDDGTVGGAGTGGIYMSVFDTTRYGGANAVPGQAPGWSPAIRLAEGDITDQPSPQATAQLRGLAGTVLYGSPTTIQLYASEFDNVAGNNSYILSFLDNTPGVLTVTQAQEAGNTVTITAKELVAGTVPSGFASGASVSINQVSTGTGTTATTGGYNGVFSIVGTPTDNGNGTFSFTYSDPTTGLGTITNPAQGVTDLFLAPTITQTLADGTVGTKAAKGLRGVAFAPVAPTSVTLSFAPANPVAPGTQVTFTATLTNPQVGAAGLNGNTVTFIDLNTGTVLGTGTISTTGGITTATFTTSTALIGNHLISAYFAGGGTSALPSATSNTVQVNESGVVTSSSAITSNLSAAAIGVPVNLTVTVTGTLIATPTGTVDFYNGSVAPGNRIGSATLNGSAVATLPATFSAAGAQTIIAVYNGDNLYASSQVSTTVTATANATATLTTSANNVALNATPTYTVTLNGNATLGSPAGTVQFFLTNTFTGTTAALGSPQTLTAGAGNTSSASVVSTALANPGSYLITVSYTPTGANNPYAAFAVNTTTSANGTALIETVQQAFAPGDLIAVQRGDGTVNLGSSGYLVFLTEYTQGGALVQKIAMPDLDAGSTHALLLSGQNGAEGLLNRSANGYFLTLTGYDLPVGRQFVTSTFPFQFPRSIALVNGAASVNTSTAISTTQVSGVNVPYNPLDAVTNDGNEFWLASNLPTGDTTDSGILYVGSVGATSATRIGPANQGSAAISIAGGQLYSTAPSGDVQAVGTGLPTTAGQILAGLPNLAADYGNATFGFPNAENPEQVLLLNTNDGTSNNPNLAYIADQANGLLKFWKDGSGNWHFGQLNTGVFGQKLVFSGGATGVVGFINNPGTATASVQLYVTGTSIQGQNPNQIDSFLDTNGAPAGTATHGVDLGFPSGNFSRIVFVGQTGSGSTANANGNMNFAGLAFAPGFQTSVNLTTSAATATFGTSITFTATVTATSGTPTGVVTFLTGGTVIGTGTLNGAGVATLTISNLGSGTHSITAFYNGDVNDGTSTSNAVSETISFVSGDVVVTRVGTGAGALSSSTASTFIDQYTTTGTANGSTPLPTTTVSATVSTIAEAGTTATATTSSAHGLAIGELVTITGSSVAGYNSTFTITAVTSTTFTFTAASGLGSATGGTATVTRTLSEAGTTTGEGYITTSTDGHSLSVGGYDTAAGNSTSGVNRDIASIGASGSMDISTQLPSTSSVRVAISADGLGFWVATGSGVRYVPFGNNGTTSTQISNEVSSPTAVGIGTNNTSGTGSGTPGQLYASAGAGAQSNGVPALDSAFRVGNGLPTSGGQAITVSASFPTARDTFNNFPSTNQFAISPDGNTLFFADSRADSLGGILEYFQATADSWVLLGSLQLDNFAISTASETGNTVTITTSGNHDFVTGQTVNINGVLNNGYNANGVTITVTGTNTFTYTLPATGLAASSGGFATSTDGGLRGLVADFSGATPVFYATTTATTGNRLVKITGGTLNGTTPAFVSTTLATAPANEAFRGVALSPKPAGATASTTTLAVTNSPANYGAGVTLTATVTTGATGWVSFRNNTTGAEIGAAQIVGNTATLVTAGNLGASATAYSIVAVYTGDSTFAASTSTAQSATVNLANTSTSLTITSNGQTVSSGGSVGTGQVINLTGTLTVPAGTAPTGTITFKNGTTVLGTAQNVSQVIVNQAGLPVITFQATLSGQSFATLQTLSLTAVYSGDGNFNTSTSSAFTLNVVNTTTTVVTTSNAAPTATPSVNVTYTATIVSSDTTDTISGSVQFFDDLLPIGSAVTVSGTSGVTATSAAFATGLTQSGTTLVPGLHSITAVYTPDTAGATHFGGSSGVYEQSVTPQALSTSDLYVYRVGDGTTNLIAQSPNPIAGSGAIGSTIYVDEYQTGTADTLVQSIILPTADGAKFNISAASEAGTTVTITTSTLNNFATGQLVTIAGITGTNTAGYNGTFSITVTDNTHFTYTAASGLGTATVTGATASSVVHAVVGNGQQSPTGQLSLSGDGQSLWVTGYDNNPINVATALPIPTAGNVPRSIAKISSTGVVQTEAFTNSGSNSLGGTGNFNSVFSPDSNSFYVGASGAGVLYFSSFTQTANLVAGTATITSNIGATPTGLENDGGNLAVVSLPYTGGVNLVGQFAGMPTANTNGLTVSNLTEAGTTVTATTSSANGFATGASVTISGATVSGYNGTFTVTVIDSTHFTFTAASGLATDASGTGRATEVLSLPGLPSTDNFQSFSIDAYFTHLGGTGAPAGINTFYLADDGPSFANGRVTKWALSSGGTWSLVDTLTAQGATGTGNQAISFYWIAGKTTGTGNGTATLEVSYGNGGNADTGPGEVYTITDSNGWNNPIGTTGVHSDAAPRLIGANTGTGTNKVFRGVSFLTSQAPSITSPATATFSFGLAGTFTAKAIGTATITWSETGTLPTGVTLNSTTGVLSGTPTQSGSFPITLTATNGVGSANQSFTLIVNPGTAPAFTSAPSTTFTVGTAGTFTVTASGSPAPTLSESGTDTLPSGVTFNASTGVLSGTPGAGTGGTYTLHFTAHNGVGSDATQTFTLTVGQAPAITSATSTTFTQGSAGTFTVTATGFPAPTFSETGTLPFGVTFNSTTGVLSGTPTVFGTYPITITASNGVGTNATQNFTLTVTGTSFGILSRPDGSKGINLTSSGVLLTFNGPIDETTLNLYNTTTLGGQSSANVTLKNGTTNIPGSLVVDPSAPNEATFVPVFGKQALPAGTYTVTVAPSAAGVAITAASFAAGSITIQTTAAPTIPYAIGQVVTISGMTPAAYNGTFVIASVVNTTTFTYGSGQLNNPGTATAFGTATLSGPQGTGAVTGAGFSGTITFSDPAPYVSIPEFARGPAQLVQFLNTDGTVAYNGIPVSITGANVTQASFGMVYDPTLLTIAPTGAVSPSSFATGVGLTGVSYVINPIDAHHSDLVVSISGGTGLSSSATITAASFNVTNNLATITTSGTPTVPYAVGQYVIVSGVTPAGYNGTFVITAVGGTTAAPTFSYVLAANPGAGTAFGTAQNSAPVVIIAASVNPLALYGHKGALDIQNAIVNNSVLAQTGVSSPGYAIAYQGDTNGDGKIGAQDSSATQQVANGSVLGYTTAPGTSTSQVNFNKLNPLVLGDVAPDYLISGQDASVESQKSNGINTNVIESVPSYTISAASYNTSTGLVTITVSSAPAVPFVTGEHIIISGIVPNGYNSPAGTFFTITVVDATDFTYPLATNPGTATNLTQAAAQVTPVFDGLPAVKADPQLFFLNARAGAGQTITMHLDLNNTDSSPISAATWSGGTVTITTTNPVGWQTGETVTISGMTPAGYNGTFTIASAISSTQFTYSLATNPGTATAFGTAGGTFALTSLDEGIVFDPNKFTVSNVRTGSLLTSGTATGWSTSANVNNTTGQIRVTQSTGTATNIAPGVVGDVLLFDVAINSTLAVGTTVVANLAASVTSNGSTTFTDANTNAGSLTLNPAPVNPTTPGQSIDPNDGVITIVGPNGNLAFDNHNVTPGSTFTEHLNLTNDVIPLNMTSLDEGIFFNPAVLQVVSATSGSGLTTGSATGWSTSANSNNTTGQIRVTQSTGTPTAVAAGAVLDVLDITFQVSATATGQTAINLAASVTSNGSTTFTDVNQNSGSIQLNPAPINPVTPGTSVDPNDATIIIVVQPNQPPFNKLPPASAIPSVLFNPAAQSGLQAATPNNDVLSSANNDGILVTDPDQLMAIFSATESGTTVTVTTTAPHAFSVGQTVVIAGLSPSGYDGTFSITGVTGTTFTYTAGSSGLANATGSGTAAVVLANPAFAIANATETGTTATITTTVPTGFVTGELVTITGMTPTGYNGTFAITVVDSTDFTYTAASGLGNATAFGTASLAPVETTELKLTGSGSSSGPVGQLLLAGTTNLTVVGNGTSDVIVTGLLADIDNALNGLIYTPGPGFFGTATLTVNTSDNGNSHFGGPLTDSRSTSITVVGLFLSEIFLNSTSNLGTPSANQYLEIYSTVPNFSIPSTVYVVGIQGNNSTVTDTFGNSTTNHPGDVTDVFKLGGFVTGSNGFLALLQKGQTYPAGDIVTAGTISTNSGTQSGFGNGGGSSAFGSLTGVHVGQDQNGVGVRLGTNPDLPGDGATAAGELSWDLPQGSSSYLLIQSPTTPAVQTGTTTATNIDGGSTATSTVAGGTAYGSWNVLDGVSILASPLAPTLGGTYTQNGPDRSYAPLTFQSATNTGTLLSGSNLVTTGTTAAPWTANYVGRISQSTGSSSADWLASVPTGTAPNFVLNATNTSNATFASQPLNSIGGPNLWADQMKVVVNDGTSSQHSQVSELTLTFASPVRLAGTADRFQITSAVDNGSAAGTATVTTSSAHDFMVGQTINIVGVTGTGWAGNKVVTAVTSTTVTFARGTITANGTTSASSFAQATGSLSTSFRNIFQVLATATVVSATEAGTTVTITTAVPHNFSTGQSVTISGVATGYNGTFSITVLSPTTFTYTAGSSGLANASGGTASVPLNLVFTIPTGGGTYVSATGVATNVTVLVVKFLATGNLTIPFVNADPLGNKVGLSDGNYFLNTAASLVTDGTGHALDGARTGTFGTNGHDEFWRLFGDVNGTRFVDALDAAIFGRHDGTTTTAASFNVSSASESGNTVTITTTGTNTFVVGQRVVIAGVGTGYNGTWVITSVNGNSFTYTALTTGLATVNNAGTAATDTADYLWYLDENEDGNIDVSSTLDSTVFFNNRYAINGGIHHLLP
jgi:hypothetical protein